jgi:hypothetical protein
VDLGVAVVANKQPLEALQPGEGALDNPASAPEAGGVLGLATGDLRCDPASGDPSVCVPRKLDRDALAWADVAVSTCSDEVCPVPPGVRRIPADALSLSALLNRSTAQRWAGTGLCAGEGGDCRPLN